MGAGPTTSNWQKEIQMLAAALLLDVLLPWLWKQKLVFPYLPKHAV